MAALWLHYGCAMASPWEELGEGLGRAWEELGKGEGDCGSAPAMRDKGAVLNPGGKMDIGSCADEHRFMCQRT